MEPRDTETPRASERKQKPPSDVEPLRRGAPEAVRASGSLFVGDILFALGLTGDSVFARSGNDDPPPANTRHVAGWLFGLPGVGMQGSEISGSLDSAMRFEVKPSPRVDVPFPELPSDADTAGLPGPG